MSYFVRNGNTFRVADNNSIDLHNHLPVGNYVIKQDQFGGMFLEQVDSFTRIGKVYGDATRNAERIIRTFLDRAGKSTGVLLTGEKGSGKTLLAKTLSLDLADNGIPTILINSPWRGDSFNKLIQDIDQPCMVLFDEFEKVYDSNEQEQMLTLLDGVYPSQKLFVLTCNDKWRIDHHMRNRPGRIFYMIDFKGLSQEFIVEYCEDNLNNKSHIQSVCTIAGLFAEFNFDMLKALVEEMNRYNEPPAESMKMLNARAEFGGQSEYDVRLFRGDREMVVHYPKVFEGNPLNPEGFEIVYNNRMRRADKSQAGMMAGIKPLAEAIESSDDWDEDMDENQGRVFFTQNDLVKVLAKTGVYEFQNATGFTAVLTKVVQRNFNYAAF